MRLYVHKIRLLDPQIKITKNLKDHETVEQYILVRTLILG